VVDEESVEWASVSFQQRPTLAQIAKKAKLNKTKGNN
tara:strand:- start:26 stop:136 length:111 start_codon:yes stop_codon:yes gene_type:complete